MAIDPSILYRGPLSSCNFGRTYRPFAKRKEGAAELDADRRALGRFVDWVGGRVEDRISILFTPRGEALTRRWYRDALARLSHLPHVARAAIQTNLACGTRWVERCDLGTLALWTTFHPSQVPRERFVARCRDLDRRGVRFSVGVVGLREQLAEADALRRELPPHVYVWVNAVKAAVGDYSADDFRRFAAIDPLFRVNTVRHASLGESCRAGRSVISVDGDGTVRRCHFIREPIGNLYAPDFESALVERPCSHSTCSCHIGYVHLDALNLRQTFGEGLLERIPAAPIWRSENSLAGRE